VEGGGNRIHKARHPLIVCGGRGRREQPSLFYIHLNAADLSFSYLRFAEAASFDKKELRRSCTFLIVVNECNQFKKYIYSQIFYLLFPFKSCRDKSVDRNVSYFIFWEGKHGMLQ
jgi:hypothetical protein